MGSIWNEFTDWSADRFDFYLTWIYRLSLQTDRKDWFNWSFIYPEYKFYLSSLSLYLYVTRTVDISASIPSIQIEKQTQRDRQSGDWSIAGQICSYWLGVFPADKVYISLYFMSLNDSIRQERKKGTRWRTSFISCRSVNCSYYLPVIYLPLREPIK